MTVVCFRCKKDCVVYSFDKELRPICENCHKNETMRLIVEVQEAKLSTIFVDDEQFSLNNWVK
jgi:hypothetical protein